MTRNGTTLRHYATALRYGTTRCLRSGHFEDGRREAVVDPGEALFAHDGLDAVEEALEARPTLLDLELVVDQLDLDRLLVRVKLRVRRPVALALAHALALALALAKPPTWP